MGFTVAVLAIGLALLLVGRGFWALWHWQGRWRWVAFLAMLPILITGGDIIRDVAADSTSHNLWPFELLAVVLVSIALVGCAELVRRIVRRPR